MTADLIIEAIVEKREPKSALFAELASAAPSVDTFRLEYVVDLDLGAG